MQKSVELWIWLCYYEKAVYLRTYYAQNHRLQNAVTQICTYI